MAIKFPYTTDMLGKAFRNVDEIPLPQVPVKPTKPLLGEAFNPTKKPTVTIPPRATIQPSLAKEAVNTNLSPTLNLKKAELQKKIRQSPDIGKSFIDTYNKTEQVVQKIEDTNQLLQNMQFGLAVGAASPDLKISSTAGKTLNQLAPASRASDITEKALWALDAIRAVGDPEYRAEADKGMGRMVDSGLEGVNLFLQALQYANQRPIAFGGATLRGWQNGINSEKQQALEELSNILDIETAAQKENNKSRILPKGYKADDAKITNPNNNKLDPSKNDNLLLELAKRAFTENNNQNY
jgi:hypothetical protein